MAEEQRAGGSQPNGSAGRHGQNSPPLAEKLLDKLLLPIITSVVSAFCIGTLLGTFIDMRISRWKTLSDYQLEREKEAHIRLYDAFTIANLSTFNLAEGHTHDQRKVDDQIDALLEEWSRQNAYISEDLSLAYDFLHTEMLIDELLVPKLKELTQEDADAFNRASANLLTGQDALKAYMRAWHTGREAEAEALIHPFVADIASKQIVEEEACLLRVLADKEATEAAAAAD